jgi:hypothetical protein
MVFVVTKMDLLGAEPLGVFSTFDRADCFVEMNATSDEDEGRYEIKEFLVDVGYEYDDPIYNDDEDDD